MRNFLVSINRESHLFFWRQHPALLFALTLVIGLASSLFWEGAFPWIFSFLWAFYLLFLKRWAILSLLPIVAIYGALLYGSGTNEGETEGIFSISTLKPHRSPFARGCLYEGTFYTKEGALSCDIYTHGPNPPQEANRDYFIQGTLKKRGAYEYLLKPKRWTSIENSFSFAQLRYLLKERYRKFISEKLPDHPRAAEFLGSLTTGDVEDRLLKYEFGRLGLQHLLAISGFHFGVLIAFSSLILSLFLPRSWKYLFLSLALTLYYLFVGPFPAVQRSWLTALAYLLGKLLKRQTSGLNLLGFSLGVEVILNPLILSNLGFQFSFVSAGGILLLHSPFERALRKFLPKRPAYDAADLSTFSRHIYIISSGLRQAIALNLAVNIAILPILLTHFHSFPPLSLLYNLFFPFAVGIALSSLLLSLAVHLLVPFLSPFLFSLVAYFTDLLLNLTSFPPVLLDYPLLIPYFPPWTIPFYLFFLMLLAIRRSENRDLVFH